MSRTVPFTLIEEMTHHFDEQLDPWNIQGELETSATIDVERLESAVETAMAVHPMTTARRRPSGVADVRYEWEIPDDPPPVRIREVDADEVDRQAARNRIYWQRFDLTEEAPFRILIYRGGGIDGGDMVMFSIHHAITDGMGSLRFGQAVWTAYRGEEPIQDSVSLQESRSMLREVRPSRASDGVEAIGSVARQLRKAVDVPTSIASAGGTAGPGWGYARRYLSEELTADLLANRPDGVSVNDVLQAALHLAIEDWNDAHGKRTGKVSVMMPVNLRPDEWKYQVVAMYSSFGSVETRARHRRTPGEAVRTIAEQTDDLSERDRAAALYKAGQFLPPGTPVELKRRLSGVLRGPGRRLTDTAMLSNLGNLPAYPSAGEDTEDRAWFSPPAWDETPVALGVATVDGRVNLFCRYLLSQFDEAAAERFLDRYVDRIEAIVDGALPAMTAEAVSSA
jgi:NRPS condensation-like uncharacterized protein